MGISILQSNIEFNGALTYNNDPHYIILHHAEASYCTPEDINQWHKDRGWIGAGYHFLVKKDGTIYALRPESAQGAHCPNYNIRSIGICAEGEFDSETMPVVQKNTIVSLCAYIKGKYDIQGIYGHRQVYQTSCPGANYPLNEIVAMANSNNIPSNIQPDTPVNPQGRSWLQVGDTGSVVERVQQQLNRLGFNCGTADGIYGKNTKNAVYKFQSAIGIQADGLAGQVTQQALINICNTPTDGVTYPHMEYPTRYIQYRVGSGVDGVFGNGTARAVIAYQNNHGLEADGIVGPGTWSALLG